MVCDDISGATAMGIILQDCDSSSSELRRVMVSVLRHFL